ncbi:MAG: F0F1 ATP synthase subunit A [Candidatus Paceibacterota bacterium]
MQLISVAHAAEEGLSIHLAPDIVTTVFGVPITSTLLTVWLTMLLLVGLAFLVKKNLSMQPGKLQNFFEMVIGGAFNYISDVLESKQLAHRFFPLIMTIFLFILTMNWVGLLPGVDSIGVYKEAESHGEVVNKLIPFFHPPATDLNITIAFALVAFVAIELAGVTLLGLFKYAGKFINFRSPLAFVIGLIELLSELARLISFSFRLFGNIFAGKTLLMVVMFLATPYLLPVPLIAYELFVGFIQAFIFAILTLFFIKIAIEEPH